MYSAYIRVTDPRNNDRPLGLAALKSLKLHFATVNSHLGNPVVRVRSRYAGDFRSDYFRTIRAIDAAGYTFHADLTKASEVALTARTGF